MCLTRISLPLPDRLCHVPLQGQVTSWSEMNNCGKNRTSLNPWTWNWFGMDAVIKRVMCDTGLAYRSPVPWLFRWPFVFLSLLPGVWVINITQTAAVPLLTKWLNMSISWDGDHSDLWPLTVKPHIGEQLLSTLLCLFPSILEDNLHLYNVHVVVSSFSDPLSHS